MAWTCPACGCEIEEEGFDTCWQCGRANLTIKTVAPSGTSISSADSHHGAPSMEARIPGLQGLSPADIQREIDQGGRFVAYHQVTSIILFSLREEVSLCFLKPGEPHPAGRLGATLYCLFFGWWAFPWGPLWTTTAIIANLSGGEQVTARTIADLNRRMGWNLRLRYQPRATAFVSNVLAMLICCALAWGAIIIFVFPYMSSDNGMIVGYLVTGIFLIWLYYVSPWNKRT